MKTIFLSPPSFLPTDPPCDVTAERSPRVAWETAEHLTQETNTDVMKTTLANDITRVIGGTYQLMNFLFSF